MVAHGEEEKMKYLIVILSNNEKSTWINVGWNNLRHMPVYRMNAALLIILIMKTWSTGMWTLMLLMTASISS